MHQKNRANKPVLSAVQLAQGYPNNLKSDFELLCYTLLRHIDHKESVDYEQESFPFVQNHSYTPDFKVKGIPVEAKGGMGLKGFDSGRRSAMLYARAQNTALKYLVVVLKYPESKCTAKMTHADWCRKNKFVWCTAEMLKNTIGTLSSSDLDESYMMLLERQMRGHEKKKPVRKPRGKKSQ